MSDTPFALTADPETINKWLAESILNSTIGATLKEAAIKTLGSYDFRKQVEATISSMVTRAAADLVEKDEELKTSIANAVAAQLTPELISNLATAAVAKLDRGY